MRRSRFRINPRLIYIAGEAGCREGGQKSFKTSRKVKTAFTEPSDILHLIYGAISALVSWINPLWSIILIIFYILYQAAEMEEQFESYADYVEFILGYILGQLILKMFT